MKKTMIALALFGFLASASSCKKDYTCTCTVSAGGSGGTVQFELKDVSKQEAEDACSGYAAVPGAYSGCSLN